MQRILAKNKAKSLILIHYILVKRSRAALPRLTNVPIRKAGRGFQKGIEDASKPDHHRSTCGRHWNRLNGGGTNDVAEILPVLPSMFENPVIS